MQYYLRKLTIYEYDPPCLIQRSGNCTSYYKSKKHPCIMTGIYYWQFMFQHIWCSHMPHFRLLMLCVKLFLTAITINTNLHLISFDCIKLAFAVNIVCLFFVQEAGLEPARPTGQSILSASWLPLTTFLPPYKIFQISLLIAILQVLSISSDCYLTHFYEIQ